MSLEKRKRLYELAKEYGVLIIEDNPYGDLRYKGEDIPAIKSFDTDNIVIYAGSFSKTIFSRRWWFASRVRTFTPIYGRRSL